MTSRIALCAVIAACSAKPAEPPKHVGEPVRVDEKPAPPADAAPTVAGVAPDQFECASLTTIDELAMLGGTVTQMNMGVNVPRGLARPCSYEVSATTFSAAWTYDIDCRDNYKETASRLLDQYRSQPKARDVQIGAKGLVFEHGLIFIDDDSPCYVRVVGDDETKRLALGKLLATKLTYANAPMTPRPMP